MSGEERNDIICPALETLEQRLLLTTMYAGDFFLYQNSQGDVIRVDLLDDSDPTVSLELVANHYVMGLVDVVGRLYWGPESPARLAAEELWSTQRVLIPGCAYPDDEGNINYFDYVWGVNGAWHDGMSGAWYTDEDGNSHWGGSTLAADPDSGVWSWTGGPTAQTVNLGTAEYPNEVTFINWGSWTEIFAIYIPHATPNTQLLVTTMQDDGMDPETRHLIDGFSGTTPYVEIIAPPPYPQPAPQGGSPAPEGTGGVLVGGIHQPVWIVAGEANTETLSYYWGTGYSDYFDMFTLTNNLTGRVPGGLAGRPFVMDNKGNTYIDMGDGWLVGGYVYTDFREPNGLSLIFRDTKHYAMDDDGNIFLNPGRGFDEEGVWREGKLEIDGGVVQIKAEYTFDHLPYPIPIDGSVFTDSENHIFLRVGPRDLQSLENGRFYIYGDDGVIYDNNSGKLDVALFPTDPREENRTWRVRVNPLYTYNGYGELWVDENFIIDIDGEIYQIRDNDATRARNVLTDKNYVIGYFIHIDGEPDNVLYYVFEDHLYYESTGAQSSYWYRDGVVYRYNPDYYQPGDKVDFEDVYKIYVDVMDGTTPKLEVVDGRVRVKPAYAGGAEDCFVTDLFYFDGDGNIYIKNAADAAVAGPDYYGRLVSVADGGNYVVGTDGVYDNASGRLYLDGGTVLYRVGAVPAPGDPVVSSSLVVDAFGNYYYVDAAGNLMSDPGGPVTHVRHEVDGFVYYTVPGNDDYHFVTIFGGVYHLIPPVVGIRGEYVDSGGVTRYYLDLDGYVYDAAVGGSKFVMDSAGNLYLAFGAGPGSTLTNVSTGRVLTATEYVLRGGVSYLSVKITASGAQFYVDASNVVYDSTFNPADGYTWDGVDTLTRTPVSGTPTSWKLGVGLEYGIRYTTPDGSATPRYCVVINNGGVNTVYYLVNTAVYGLNNTVIPYFVYNPVTDQITDSRSGGAVVAFQYVDGSFLQNMPTHGYLSVSSESSSRVAAAGEDLLVSYARGLLYGKDIEPIYITDGGVDLPKFGILPAGARVYAGITVDNVFFGMQDYGKDTYRLSFTGPFGDIPTLTGINHGRVLVLSVEGRFTIKDPAGVERDCIRIREDGRYVLYYVGAGGAVYDLNHRATGYTLVTIDGDEYVYRDVVIEDGEVVGGTPVFFEYLDMDMLEYFANDIQHILVMGTVAGSVTLPSAIQRCYIGFMWGNIVVGTHADTIVLKVDGETTAGFPNSSIIYVAGHLRVLDVTVGNLVATVTVNNTPNIESPPWNVNVVQEWLVEGNADEIVDMVPKSGWLYGYWLDYANDTMETAQYISTPTGGWLTIVGRRATSAVAGAAVADGGEEEDVAPDWYAITLLAGQRLVVDGIIPGMMVPDLLNNQGLTRVKLVDMYGNVIDTLGQHSETDANPTDNSTWQRLIDFTVAEAGVYYILAESTQVAIEFYPNYELYVNVAEPTALGALRVAGAFGSDQEGAPLSRLLVENGGSIGGVDIVGANNYAAISALRGGNIQMVRAGEFVGSTVGGVPITSQNNVGLVWSGGDADLVIYAGTTFYNDNAFVQNVYIGGTFLPSSFPLLPNGIFATGSIGIIEVGGDIGTDIIQVNTDNIGAPGTVDLILVHGGWGSRRLSPPVLVHGLGGDIRYVVVEGTIYEPGMDGFQYPVPPTIYTDGRTVTRHDDAGGVVTISGKVPVLDARGRQQRDSKGELLYTISTISFREVDVQDGVGGVLTDLIADGPVIIKVNGVSHMGHFTANGDVMISIATGGSSTSALNIYYVDGSGYADIGDSLDVTYVIDDVGRIFRDNANSGGSLTELSTGATFYWTDEGNLRDSRGNTFIMYNGSLGYIDPNNNVFTAGGTRIGIFVDGIIFETRLGVPDEEGTPVVYLEVSPYEYSSRGPVNGWSAADARPRVGAAQHRKGISFTNTTLGTLVSGVFSDIGWMNLKGSIGTSVGNTGAWIPGMDEAPVSADPATEVQFGWFHNRINGLNILGDVADLRVGGSLGDLRITGNAERIVVNSDNWTAAFRWDGLYGVVWTGGYLRSIAVGDGTVNTGGGFLARSGIFATGWIGTVSISGPCYPGGLNMFGDPMVYGELRGVIIAADFAGSPTGDAIGLISGTNGARMTGWVMGSDLNSWYAKFAGYGLGEAELEEGASAWTWFFNGGIGTIHFSGAGAWIYSTTIYGMYLNTVTAARETNGIWLTYFVGGNPNGAGDPSTNGRFSIGRINAGGPGLISSFVYGGANRIGYITGLGPDADIRWTTFQSPDGIISLIARDIDTNYFSVPGKIDSITATRNFINNSTGAVLSPQPIAAGVKVGGIGKLTVGNDFRNNTVEIAGRLDSAVIRGEFADSILAIYGDDAFTKSITVGKNITNSLIVSAGRIGKVIVSGMVSSNSTIETTTRGSGTWGNLDYLQVDQGYFGNLTVGGKLGTFLVKTSLGFNPVEVGYTQTFNIWGDVGLIRVQSSGKDPVTRKAIPSDLFANFNVGGNIQRIQVDGTLYGDIRAVGDLENLILTGGLGGYLHDEFGDPMHGRPTTAADPMARRFGSVHALGALKTLKFNTAQDLAADLFFGGSLKSLTLKGADITGNITLLGTLGTLSVTNGSILGDVTVRSVNKVSVTGGNLGVQHEDDSVTGNLTVTNGSVKNITIKNGSLIGDIQVNNGGIDLLAITGSLNGLVSVSGNVKKATVTGGNLNGALLAGDSIGTVTVRNGDIAGLISGDYGVGTVTTNQALTSVIRSGGNITKVSAGSMAPDSLISAAHNIGTVAIKGNMIGAAVLAGYDVGVDGEFGTVDDNPVTGGVHAGSINSVTIGGAFNDSLVSAGVNPVTRDEAPGVSRVVKMKVGSARDSVVLADTSIGAAFVKSVTTKGLGVTLVSGEVDRLGPIPGTAVAFGPTVGKKLTSHTANGLTFTLTGAGKASYDSDTHTLYLEGTTAKSKLTIRGANATGLTIFGQDDAALGLLDVSAGVALETIDIDGLIGQLKLAESVSGTMYMPGGVTRGTVVSLAPSSTFGDVGTLAVANGAVVGNLQSDTVKTLTVGTKKVLSDMTFGMEVLFGGIGTLTVNGLLSSANIFRGDVRTVTAMGSTAAAVLSLHAGSLNKLNSNSNPKLGLSGDWSGVVDVQRGRLVAATFGGSVTNTAEIHTTEGINKITVKGYKASKTYTFNEGNMSGVIATRGDLGSVSVKGDLNGRIGAAGSGKTLTVGSMTNGLVTFGGDLNTVKIAGTMYNSMILSGFDSGSQGYEPGVSRLNAAQLDSTRTAAGYEDRPSTGSIKTVTIGGQMMYSSIGAAVSPGHDGYLGSDDDWAYGVGKIGKVTVRGAITGAPYDSDAMYGIVAASNLPTVTMYRNGYAGGQGMVVTWLRGMAGNLQVSGVSMRFRSVEILFNHPLNMSAFREGSMHLLISNNSDYVNDDGANGMYDLLDPALYQPGMPLEGLPMPTIEYDEERFGVTISVSSSWEWYTWACNEIFRDTFGGDWSWLRIVVEADEYDMDGHLTRPGVRDNRDNGFDGEYSGWFPSGDGVVGGDFVYDFTVRDIGDTFADAMLLPGIGVDEFADNHFGSFMIGSMFDGWDSMKGDYDVDIFYFTGVQYTYFSASVAVASASSLTMALYWLDDSGPVDYYKLVSCVEDGYGTSVTAAWELPEDGQYYLAIKSDTASSPTSYTLNVDYWETDANLRTALGGSLPWRMSYVSNVVGEHNNYLGANNPKQLVYVNFNGGTAVKMSNADVGAFTFADVDAGLVGREGEFISGVMDYILEIYRTVPASIVAAGWTVEMIDGVFFDWSNYESATNGLFFTTVDPATQGYSASTDFTTIFVGYTDLTQFGYGPGSTVLGLGQMDRANADKANNAIIFAQQYAGEASVLLPLASRLDQYICAFANSIAHELGHNLGMNHQPTSGSGMLVTDMIGGNVWPASPARALMAYGTMYEYLTTLSFLGTAPLEDFTSLGSRLGHIDTLTMASWWLI